MPSLGNDQPNKKTDNPPIWSEYLQLTSLMRAICLTKYRDDLERGWQWPWQKIFKTWGMRFDMRYLKLKVQAGKIPEATHIFEAQPWSQGSHLLCLWVRDYKPDSVETPPTHPREIKPVQPLWEDVCHISTAQETHCFWTWGSVQVQTYLWNLW